MIKRFIYIILYLYDAIVVIATQTKWEIVPKIFYRIFYNQEIASASAEQIVKSS